VKYSLDQYELDTRSAELRCADTEIALTPKTYALLCLLVGNHDRLVSKDEIVEKVWDGRIVSDATISTAIKSVRRALGDSGQAQKYIRTIHGRGFRFNVQVRVVAPAAAGARAVDRAAEPSDSDTPPAPSGKPTIAIIPFRPLGYSPAFSAIADAVPAELISSLSRLRWLTVVARGSTFRFRGPETDYAAIRASLGANYCLSGVVEIFGDKLTILVDLADTRTKSVIWSERFSSKIDDIHAIRAEIVACTISELELHIPLNEALRARVRQTAWMRGASITSACSTCSALTAATPRSPLVILSAPPTLTRRLHGRLRRVPSPVFKKRF
jgi:TolB-like protein